MDSVSSFENSWIQVKFIRWFFYLLPPSLSLCSLSIFRSNPLLLFNSSTLKDSLTCEMDSHFSVGARWCLCARMLTGWRCVDKEKGSFAFFFSRNSHIFWYAFQWNGSFSRSHLAITFNSFVFVPTLDYAADDDRRCNTYSLTHPASWIPI